MKVLILLPEISCSLLWNLRDEKQTFKVQEKSCNPISVKKPYNRYTILEWYRQSLKTTLTGSTVICFKSSSPKWQPLSRLNSPMDIFKHHSALTERCFHHFARCSALLYNSGKCILTTYFWLLNAKQITWNLSFETSFKNSFLETILDCRILMPPLSLFSLLILRNQSGLTERSFHHFAQKREQQCILTSYFWKNVRGCVKIFRFVSV